MYTVVLLYIDELVLILLTLASLVQFQFAGSNAGTSSTLTKSGAATWLVHIGHLGELFNRLEQIHVYNYNITTKINYYKEVS